MKKSLKLIPLLLGILLTATSCLYVDRDDDRWDDDDYYYNPDEELSLYLREGRWYPMSKSGLTECEFNSYMIFRGHSMYTYDCHEVNYDAGTFSVHDGYLKIHYDNGDLMTYRIVRASNGELEIRSTSDGITYLYVRN